MSWQSIETAPKDRVILLLEEGGKVPLCGVWKEGRPGYERGGRKVPDRPGRWEDDGEGLEVKAVLWHELPAPPWAEKAPTVQSPEAMEQLRAITAEMFELKSIEAEQYPGDGSTHLLVSVVATGSPSAISERRFEWHKRIHYLVGFLGPCVLSIDIA